MGHELHRNQVWIHGNVPEQYSKSHERTAHSHTGEGHNVTTSPIRPPPKKQKAQTSTHTDPINTVAESSQSAHPGTQAHTRMEERPPPHNPRNPEPGPRQSKKRHKRHNPPDNTKPITDWFKPAVTPTEPEDTDMEPQPPTDHQHTPTHNSTPTGESDWKRTYTHPLKELAHLIAVSWNVNGVRTKNVVVEGTSQLTMVVRAILPDILFLQETHYTAGGEHKDYVEGMTVFHSSIPRGRTRSGRSVELPTHQQGRRAGLATALRNSLDPNRIATKLSETQSLRGYLLPLRVETARGSMLVLNTYLPPDDTHGELIMDLIESWIHNNRKRGEPILITVSMQHG